MSTTEDKKNIDMGPFKGGRPFKFTDPSDLRIAMQSYFDRQDPHMEERYVESGVSQHGETIFAKRKIMTQQKPYTMEGLALSLGTHRETLTNYQNPDHYSSEIPDDVRQQLIDTVHWAKAKCAEYAEESLYSPFSAGAKFSLTNNHGWVDKTVQQHEGGFFDKRQVIDVVLVNPEVQPEDETPPEPNTEPSSPPTS